MDQLAADLPAAADPVQPAPHVRPDGRRHRQGYAIARRHGGRSAVGVARGDHRLRAARTPAPCRRPSARRWRARRPASASGSALVRRRDHADLDRGGQLVPRLLHRARRRDAAAQHDARRGRARRRRLRPLRHAGPGHHHGLRGRADGRPDARSTWARRSAPGRSSSSPCTSWSRPRSCSSAPALAMAPPATTRRAAQHAARTACPRCSTPSPRPPTTTARAFAGITRRTRRSATPRWAWPCCSAGSCRSSSCSPWPGRWPASSPCRVRRAPCRPTGRCSSACSSASTVVVAAPHLLPRARSRPARRRPLMTTPARPPSRDPRRCRPAASRAGLLDPAQLRRSLPGRAAQARPAHPVAQPGDVRRRGRRGAHHRPGVTDPCVFAWSITVWLWLTVVFANLAEAVAEGRGKAQAATLRRTKHGHRRPPAVARRRPRSASPATELRARRPRRRRGRARPSPATATSSRASPASTSRPSPASPRR